MMTKEELEEFFHDILTMLEPLVQPQNETRLLELQTKLYEIMARK